MAELPPIIKSQFEGINNHEADSMAADMGPDLEIHAPGLGAQRGIEAFHAFGEAFFTAFPDATITADRVVEQGDVVVVEGHYSGTHTGPLLGAQGEVPPTGRDMSLPFCDVYVLRDGKIVAHHVYYDQVKLLGQLGLAAAAAPSYGRTATLGADHGHGMIFNRSREGGMIQAVRLPGTASRSS
jgi:predicted ester cyclase